MEPIPARMIPAAASGTPEVRSLSRQPGRASGASRRKMTVGRIRRMRSKGGSVKSSVTARPVSSPWMAGTGSNRISV